MGEQKTFRSCFYILDNTLFEFIYFTFIVTLITFWFTGSQQLTLCFLCGHFCKKV